MSTDPSDKSPQAQGIFGHDQMASYPGDILLRAVANGEFEHPPIYRAMGITIVHIDGAKVALAATTSTAFLNPMGFMHGGYVSTLLDACMGCAVHSRLPSGVTYTTIELKANFVRGLKPGVPVRATGNVIHLGRRLATAEGRLVDGSGTLYAHGTCTCAILSLDASTARGSSCVDSECATG